MATVKKTATKKTEAKRSTKKENKNAIVLTDNVLWAVVRKSWFGGGVVEAVYTTRTAAENAAALLTLEYGKTYVVQRAELKQASYQNITIN